MLRADIFNMNPIFRLGDTSFRIKTDAGSRRYSLVSNGDLPPPVGIMTGIPSRTLASGRRVEAANPNSMGPVVFGAARSYKVLDTWVYSINSSGHPALATHAFGERKINNVWQLVLIPRLGVAAGGEVTVYYEF